MISVLYVDDERDLTEVAQHFLEHSGDIRVTAVTSAQAALGMDIKSFDAIISDYLMPAMDGIMFLKAVRQQHGDIPFILFTGRGREEVVIEAINNGADSYLQKGGDPEAQFAELAHRIHQAVKRRQAEQSLQESEKRLADIINFLPDATFAIDRAGQVIAWNRAIEEMTGVMSADMLGKGGYEYAIPFYGTRRPILIDLVFEPDSIFRGQYSRIINEKDTLIAETVLPRPRDRPVMLMGKASPLYNRQGDVVGAIESIRDITERKRSERELMESEGKFRGMAERISDVVLLVDKEFCLTYASPSFLKLTGKDSANLLGKPLLIEPLTSREQEMIRVAFEENRNLKTTGPLEITYTISGRGTVIFEFHGVPVQEDGIFSGVQLVGHDITNLRRTQDELRSAYEQLAAAQEELRGQYDEIAKSRQEVAESEERFRAVSEYSHNAICIVDETGKILWANEQVLALGGYSREQIYGAESFAVFIAPESLDWVLANFKKFAAGEPYEHHYRLTIIRADGERRLCTKHMTDFSDRRGKRNLVINMLDITEQTKAEEALRERESQFRRITDNAPDMIYRMSLPDATYEYISPASVALTGYRPEEFYENPGLLRSLIHPSWQEYFRMQWDALMAGNVPPNYEFQIVDRAGQARWLNQRNMLVTDYNGKTIAIEGIVTDITRQKNTERELRRNELRSLAVNTNAGSWIWEIDPDGMYRYSSPAVLSILGYKAEEIVGRMYFYELFDPSVREDLTRQVFAAMEGREPFRNFENLNVHKDGKRVLLRTGGTPVFDEDGTFAGYCGVDEDITERRAAETAFQAIVKSMVGTTGIASLWQIAETVSSWLGTECVMVGEIQPDRKNIRVHAMVLDGKRIEDFSYSLEGTPCEDVRGMGYCCYPDNAMTLFPNAKDIMELRIRSYVGTPLRDSEGNVFGILCALSRSPLRIVPSMQEIMDIIAVKAAAEIESMQMTRALKESEQKFRSLVEYALEGIFITDMTGNILFANNAVAQMLEVSGGGQGLHGRNVMEFVAPESQPAVIHDYAEVAKGHDAYLAQYKVITEKKKEIYIESLGKVITYEGQPADLISVHDITERKRAEDALSRSQQMLAEAMDLAHLVNWEYDVAKDLFTFDERFYALYGTTADREGGSLMSSEVYAREFVHPDDRHLVGEEVARSLETTDPDYISQIEHRIIRRDGEIRHVVVRIRLEKDDKGRTVRTHGANQDITDIRKAEEALRQSEAKYRLLAENVHDVIFTADMDMQITYISPSVMALRGFTAEEAMAQSLPDAITPASLEVMMRSRETGIEYLNDGNTVLPSSTMELEFYRKDGSTVWTETIVALAYDNYKKPVGIVGVIRDITQRKQVENALMESEEKFRSLVETTPGIIWEIDTAGTFLYISPMVREILGYEPDALVGESFRGMVPEQMRPLLMRTLASMAVTSPAPLFPFEIIARHRDGHDLVMEIRPSRVTGTDGKVIGFRGVAYDTTRRKKAEEELKRANRQLNLLGSITRHDLLNKITVILGNLKIVEKMSTGTEEGEYLKKIRYSTNAIKSQIEFTRVYQNLGTHEPQWIALDSVMPRPHVPSSVTLKAGVQDIEILADPMLEKVFFNLIDNSVRHGKRVTEVHVTTRPSGEDLVIVWEDNGVGIESEDKERIFERGFGTNTGLGMFLAREILSLTNIMIKETGEPGRGARFEITVPNGAYRTRNPARDE